MSAGRRYRRRLHRRVLTLVPEIPEDAPPAVREGVARRRLVATTGRCPCGAQLHLPEHPTPGTFTSVAVHHEDWCPAADPNLRAAMEEI